MEKSFKKEINKGFRWKNTDDNTSGNSFVPNYEEDYESTIVRFGPIPGTYYQFGTLEELYFLNVPNDLIPTVIWFRSSDPPTMITFNPSYTLHTPLNIQPNKCYELSIIKRHVVCVEFE